jgi:tetratricopeptide (TPR) repeat protein
MTHKLLATLHPTSSVITKNFIEMTEEYAPYILPEVHVEEEEEEEYSGSDVQQQPQQPQQQSMRSSYNTMLTIEYLQGYMTAVNPNLVQLVKNNRALAYDTRTAYCVAHVGVSLVCKALNNNGQLSDIMFDSAVSLVEDDRMYRELFYFCGETNRKMYDYKNALQYYENCLLKNENEFRSLIGIGRIYTSIGKYEQAKDIFESISNKLPGNELAIRYLDIIKERPIFFRSASSYYHDIDIVTVN